MGEAIAGVCLRGCHVAMVALHLLTVAEKNISVDEKVKNPKLIRSVHSQNGNSR